MNETRLIIECMHCGAMFDVGDEEIKDVSRFRCRVCRKVFAAGQGVFSSTTSRESPVIVCETREGERS